RWSTANTATEGYFGLASSLFFRMDEFKGIVA
ncbi:MAG: hypothetical protein ACD_77C00117G0001, partial [uncultured bacterium]